METKNCYVYALKDPREDKPFYVGKGTEDRAYVHMQKHMLDKDSNRHKKHKILKILNEGLNVEVVILKNEMTSNEALEYEKEMIRFYGRKDLGTGCLTNMTDGGDGNSGFSLEVNLKISKSLRGKKQSEETKLKRRETNKKNCVDYGKGNRGKKRPEHSQFMKELLSERGSPMKGRTHSDEAKEKMSKTIQENLRKLCCISCHKEITFNSAKNHYKKCDGEHFSYGEHLKTEGKKYWNAVRSGEIKRTKHMWITNGVISKHIPIDQEIPEGFYKGRVI